MINDNSMLMVAFAVVSGILTDIYRRFHLLGAHKDRLIKIETLTEEHRDDIKEIKDDIKYLVRTKVVQDRDNK